MNGVAKDIGGGNDVVGPVPLCCSFWPAKQQARAHMARRLATVDKKLMKRQYAKKNKHALIGALARMAKLLFESGHV